VQRDVRLRARGGGGLDPYKVLEIPRNSSRAEIRAAYLERMKLYHPDVSMEEDAAEVAVQLNVAYQQLMEVDSTNFLCSTMNNSGHVWGPLESTAGYLNEVGVASAPILILF
jgi:preprotein translocase subunit Sec63